MTRRLLVLDRLACLLLGAALLVLGLAALDWHYGWTGTAYRDRLSTSASDDVLAASWWPWVFAAAGLVVGLAGLAWLLAHLRRRPASTLRLSPSGPTGRLSVDLGSVCSAVAARYAELAPATGVRGRLVSRGHRHVVEITGHVDPRADVATLARAAATCAADLAAALPDEVVTCRVLLGAPQRRRPARVDHVRVGADPAAVSS